MHTTLSKWLSTLDLCTVQSWFLKPMKNLASTESARVQDAPGFSESKI